VRPLALLGTTLLVAACGAPSTTHGVEGNRSDPVGPPLTAFSATVERVVDGDTFIARRGGRSLRVRLIGINAPESVKPNWPVECFGPEASRVLHGLLPVGTKIRAAYEAGGQRDRYGRELWDVWLADGRFLQALLVEDGAARARLYRPQHAYAALLAGLGDRARQHDKGLWGSCHTG
jgi:micrococcal nuclease